MQDISSLADNSLVGHASMNGTNMVSETPFGSLPGSTSEATAGVERGNPDVDIPDTYDVPNRLTDPNGTDPFEGHTWTKAISTAGDKSAHSEPGHFNGR